MLKRTLVKPVKEDKVDQPEEYELKDFRQEQSAIQIQRWFRGLYAKREQMSTCIINNHEKELELKKIKPSELKAFVHEVKLNQISKIIMQSNAGELAIAALQSHKISTTEASTILEIAQLVRVRGKQNIEFIPLLDAKNELTVEAKIMLTSFWQQNRVKGILPKEYAGLEKFLNDVKMEFKILPPCAKHFCRINKKALNDNAKATYKICILNSVEEPDVFSRLSFGASNTLKKLIFKKDAVTKELRLGQITMADIEKKQHANIRLASISTKTVATSTKPHGIETGEDGYSEHDEHHAESECRVPKMFRNDFRRIVFLVRDYTGIDRSNEIYTLIDRPFVSKKITGTESNEILFYKLLANVSMLDVEDKTAHIDDKGLEYKTRANNKNGTSVVMWIMVMDMVDCHDIWRDYCKIDIDKPTFAYNQHIALYKKLLEQENFKALSKKEKIYLLEKNYRLLLTRDPTTMSPKDDKLLLECPAEHTLFFKKLTKKESDKLEMGKNKIYLVERTDAETPKESQSEGIAVSEQVAVLDM